MFAVSKLPVTTPTTKQTRQSKLGMAWMWGCLLLAGGFLWHGLSGDSHSSRPLIAASTPNRVPIVSKYETKLIREIRVGERVLAHNPEVSDSERAEAIEPDPATWRQIELTMEKADGGSLEITLLRPTDWLQAHAEMVAELAEPGWFIANQLLLNVETRDHALVGKTIELDLPELGAAGPARIVRIAASPSIEPRSEDGRQVVTGTFRHSSGDVLDLHIDGEPKPIGATANHPFWSEDRQAFVPACQLTQGETLRHADNTITQVTRINPRRGPPATVYNLEVNAEHVYYVGQDGVLVHNNCAHGNSLASTAANHGYAIFNRATGQIMKFGISSQRIAGNGQSYRVTAQLRQQRALGVDAFGVILNRFPNRASALAWERAAVNAGRGQNWSLPLQIRP